MPFQEDTDLKGVILKPSNQTGTILAKEKSKSIIDSGSVYDTTRATSLSSPKVKPKRTKKLSVNSKE